MKHSSTKRLSLPGLAALSYLLVTPTAAWSYTSVTAGGMHACAIDSEAQVNCDTDFHATRLLPPDDMGTFQVVEAGQSHTCGIQTDGSVSCWGDGYYGQLDVPAMSLPVVALSAGRNHNCAIDSAGAIRCWGLADNGRTSIPGSVIEQASGQSFVSVSTQGAYTCAIDSASQPLCWTELTALSHTDPPAGLLAQQVEAYSDEIGTTNLACALDVAGEVACWGWFRGNSIDESNTPDFPNAPYVDVAVGDSAICAVAQTGELDCLEHTVESQWYSREDVERTVAGKQIVAVDSGYRYHMCVTDSEGFAWCWDRYRTLDYLQDVPELVVEGPTNLSAEVYAADLIELFWQAPTRFDQAFEIYRNDELLAVTDNENSYMVDGLQPGQEYRFRLRSLLPDGTVSDFSNEIVVDTASLAAPVVNYTPPSRNDEPSGLRADVYWENTVELFWDRQSTTVLGYEIRRNGSYIGFTDGISYIDDSVQGGDSLRYDVIAVNSAGTILGFASIEVAVGEQQCQ